MRVRDAMTTDVLSVRHDELVRGAARRMVERWVGSAMVQREGADRGIFTERDVLELVGAGQDLRSARVAEHCTPEAAYARPDWTLERAAEIMASGGFRHLPVRADDALQGIISIRDIVRHWTKERARRPAIEIREAMTRDVITVGRDAGLADAARQIAEHGVGAAVVEPRKRKAPPGIITDREVLAAVGTGHDPRTERVGEHISRRMTFSAPDWSLKQAAEAMTKGGFQHVVVVDATGTVGVISMRDIIRRWLD